VITRDVVFHDRYGLHPRAARRIQASLGPFDSTVSLENLDGAAAAVDARGMLALISSGIRAGDRVRITADGTDETAAIDAIGDLLASGVCHPDGVR
jgi:phosphotransferase system HPr (HPr) family protein